MINETDFSFYTFQDKLGLL